MSTIRSFLLIVILSLLIFSPIMSVASRIYSDFGDHAEIVDKMQQGETTHVSHPLYHLAFMLVNSLAPDLPDHELGLLTVLLFILPLPVMIYMRASVNWELAASVSSVFESAEKSRSRRSALDCMCSRVSRIATVLPHNL